MINILNVNVYITGDLAPKLSEVLAIHLSKNGDFHNKQQLYAMIWYN